MNCPYCKGARIMDNAVYGKLACRICLGTGQDEGELPDHEVHSRELRRIAELLLARDAMSLQRARAGVELGAGIAEAIRVFDEALAKGAD